MVWPWKFLKPYWAQNSAMSRSDSWLPGEHVNLAGAGFHEVSHFVQAAAPVHQVAGGEVIVGFDFHQLLKSGTVAVDIREDQGPSHQLT